MWLDILLIISIAIIMNLFVNPGQLPKNVETYNETVGKDIEDILNISWEFEGRDY